MKTTTDILSKIAERDAAPAKTSMRLVKRYAVMYSGRASRKLYTYTAGRKLVARAKRMGLDAYLAPMMVKLAASATRRRP